MRGWLGLALLAGCTGTTPGTKTGETGETGTSCTSGCDDWQPVSYVDEGEVCFEASGGDVVVYVTAPDCLSSSCSRDLGGSCEAVVTGTAIALSSEVHWEDNVGDVSCTDDCGAPMVSCTISGLADGTYQLTFGGEQHELVVPVTDGCT